MKNNNSNKKKNNNSNKKAVTILCLAMVLALPITSHADGQETEENALNAQNYMGGVQKLS